LIGRIGVVARGGETVKRDVAAVLARLALGCLVVLLALLPQLALADDSAKLFATTEKGFGRMILDFPDRLDLPPYHVTSNDGVLSIIFSAPVDFTVPDVAAALPDYVSVARVDPDGRGIRFGLRTAYTVNQMAAGEQLFVDLLPTSWQGLPPGLPQAVVDKLASRAQQAALKAEQERRTAEAKVLKPVATVSVGRNPTFMRVEFNWNVDTKGQFAFDGKAAKLSFDWPVPIDLYRLKTGLPKELQSVDGRAGPWGSDLTFHVARDVVPRFYQLSSRDFIVDIDTPSTVPANPDPLAAATVKAVNAAKAEASAAIATSSALGAMGWLGQALSAFNQGPTVPITPTVKTVGSTIRIAFPFVSETAAAVFRRGDTVWMLFDSPVGINQPAFSDDLAALAKSFTVIPVGDAQVVRLDLSPDRLATLGSEGMAWVLSIGDMLLDPTTPMVLGRRVDARGLDEVTADLVHPGRIHDFKDPVVGDDLRIVTAYPPARGLPRDLSYVDFEALRSVQGLVVRPEHDDLTVALDGTRAVIGAPGGLTLSSAAAIEAANGAPAATDRNGFIDLRSVKESDPVAYGKKIDEMTAAAAAADGSDKDLARLNLARLYLANQYGFEALGVLKVLESDLKRPDLRRDTEEMTGAADVASSRPADALGILNSPAFANDIDAEIWRSIAEADSGDYQSAKRDALASQSVVASYPSWLRTRFLLAALRSALETGDAASAEQFEQAISFADLTPEDVSLYRLLTGWLAETEGRNEEALDTYGQVIAEDVRPTRAEAVYRTIHLLDKLGKIDDAKAIKALAAEALLWRGDAQESNTDQFLTALYFRTGQYRLGFETARNTVSYFPAGPAMSALSTEAQQQFEALFLDGRADALPPVEALALFYDFKQLTPPGSQGDMMIRNLARRLVKIGLLPQAAELLEYQINDRLSGAGRAEVAADLAVIDLADHDPQDAIAVLTSTELQDLPPNLERRRRLLEGRALIDSNRIDLGLDVISSVTGRDADELRVDANWASKDYEAVGRIIEVMYGVGSSDASGPGLSQAGQMDMVRAAVAYALAGDRIGLSRLRAKFSDSMARSPQWPMFDYVTSTIEPVSSPNFAKVAESVANIDELNNFLASYKATYGGPGAIVPATVGTLDAAAALPPSTPPAG
jgi:hypothetical protein